MKQLKVFFAALLLLCFTAAFTQENLEDVLYLKNGNIYRGTIIEQVPGETVKIQITGGSIFTVTIPEIQKMTREQRYRASVPEPRVGYPRQQPMHDHYEKQGRMSRSYDSTYVPHYLKKRGYFFIAELRGGPGNGSLRIVNGYKFGRFGFLGIGVGLDGAMFDGGHMQPLISSYRNNYSDGLYLPLYIRYSGDILRKRITPFYYLELGYAAHPTGMFFGNDYGGSVSNKGGPIAAVGFGCKFNTRKRVNFNININANWKSNFYDGYTYYYDDQGNYYQSWQSGMDGKLFGSLGFGIGF